jgi:hypothetical protein
MGSMLPYMAYIWQHHGSVMGKRHWVCCGFTLSTCTASCLNLEMSSLEATSKKCQRNFMRKNDNMPWYAIIWHNHVHSCSMFFNCLHMSFIVFLQSLASLGIPAPVWSRRKFEGGGSSPTQQSTPSENFSWKRNAHMLKTWWQRIGCKKKTYRNIMKYPQNPTGK